MKYLLKQKLISFGDDFDVLDEQGRKAFYFDSKTGGFTAKIIVLSDKGEQLAVIKKKMFSFRPTYIVKKDGKELARIFKKAFSFRKSFIVDIPGPNDITVNGKFVEHGYLFYQDGRQIAEVSKKWFTGKDTYGVDIENPNNTLLILCASVIIDILCHPGRDSSF
jgi:uncharacterized protein YxjI